MHTDCFLPLHQAPASVPQAWHDVPEEVRLTLAREALRRAADILTEHAELLAAEMESGALMDLDGSDALRLFAEVIRANNQDGFATIGNA